MKTIPLPPPLQLCPPQHFQLAKNKPPICARNGAQVSAFLATITLTLPQLSASGAPPRRYLQAWLPSPGAFIKVTPDLEATRLFYCQVCLACIISRCRSIRLGMWLRPPPPHLNNVNASSNPPISLVGKKTIARTQTNITRCAQNI